MADNKKNVKKKTYKRKPTREVTEKNDNRTVNIVLAVILTVLGVMCGVSLIIPSNMGVFGKAASGFILGMAGGAGYAVPVLFVAAGVIRFKRREEDNHSFIGVTIFQFIFYLSLAVLIHMWTGGNTEEYEFKALYESGAALTGGGIFGGVAVFLIQIIGKIGTHIIFIPVLVIFGILSFGVKPYDVYIAIAYEIKHSIAERKRIKEESGEEAYQRELERQREETESRVSEVRNQDNAAPRVRIDPNDRHRFVPDVDELEIGENEGKAENGEEPPKTEEEQRRDNVFKRIAKKFGNGNEDDEDDGIYGEPEDTEISDADADKPPFDMEGVTVKQKPVLPDVAEGKTEAVKDVKSESGDTGAVGGDNMLSTSDAAVLSKFAEEFHRGEQQKGKGLSSGEAEKKAVVKREYVYPPLSLLKYEYVNKNKDISEELTSTAEKLVEALHSFKVDVDLVGVSRGPTITRYELSPKEGVRVRQIANLDDDLSLKLASVVRIEAPIQGKAAVGVEVPNKTVSTVYLREAVDTETFRKSASPLTVALGMDVAGEPVFLDIEKMPHLLIAGATGMGKSVCINSIITSLLYKSSPEDVNLILIDPKNVEFVIYNGLPHLLVPVVSDPKKAAGALQWAVSEMERRFVLLASLGVRDIKSYNQVIAGDPDREHLSRIVIVIDELADLMMTAPKDVENYIQRLAQKARAAGMHLIIGTQRPSTDVITGTIKGNIPSKIAFTVSSQVDSRVILDCAGAESLIGRGDMLYAPVGSTKPRRVQGAFVSEGEIEAVVKFIKDKNERKEGYDEEVMNSIEANSQNVGKKKGDDASDDDFSDDGDTSPQLRKAIELAVETGKISTSLIQRRMSLGYGKAAKLIDEMEARGIVSPPEGQKPRTTLITKQQYMEMFVTRGEDL